MFDQFGGGRLGPDHGGFNRCDVLIDLPDDTVLDVLLQFDESDETPPDTVVRGEAAPDGDGCVATPTLTDAGVVEVATKTDDWSDAELCDVATAALDHAEAVLREVDEVPRRVAPDPRSLALVDACTLLTRTDLARAGIRGSRARARFRELVLPVALGRRFPVGDLRPGATSRTTKVFNRTYQNDFGDELVETALLVVERAHGDLAVGMSGPVAAKLPG